LSASAQSGSPCTGRWAWETCGEMRELRSFRAGGFALGATAFLLALPQVSQAQRPVHGDPDWAEADKERKRIEELKKTRDKDLLEAYTFSGWGEVKWDKCSGAWIEQKGSGKDAKPAWFTGGGEGLDMVCSKGTRLEGFRKSELKAMFPVACAMLFKARKNAYWGIGVPKDAFLGAKEWWKKINPQSDPKSDKGDKFLMIMRHSHYKCKRGVQIECNWCEEPSTTFIAGNKLQFWVQDVVGENPDLQICPGMCDKGVGDSGRRELLIDVIHEITHYGGSRDTDSPWNSPETDPNEFAKYIPHLAQGLDDYMAANKLLPAAREGKK